MTYVLDFATLQEGMQVGVFYRTDAPAPLIFPPQYQASVIIPDRMGVNVDEGYYNNMLVNENQTLQLNLNGEVASFEKGKLVSTDTRIKVDDILIDGKTVGDIGDLVLKDREILSDNGIVIVNVNVDKEKRSINCFSFQIEHF